MPRELSRPAPDRLTAAVAAILDARLRRDTEAPVALGLSGGGDSLTLLHLAAHWTAQAGRPLLALTVDHGLSPQSSGWTARAGAMARAAGATWRPLAWTGAKPAAGLPAAARAARHRLLADAARHAGATVILLGHTADDVAEGEWMRDTGAAPALGRVREWGPSPAWPEGRGTFLLRPLLSTSREDLRAWLRPRGLGWIDDDANDDPRFARARARRALHGAAADPVVETASTDLAAFAEAVAGPPDGSLDFALADLLQATSPAKALSAVLLCAGGRDRPASAVALRRAVQRLGEGQAVTLAGAKAVHRAGRVVVARDPGRTPLTGAALEAGTPAVWDGRFAVEAAAAGWTVRPLAGLAAKLPRAERAALREAAPAARGLLPAFVSAEGEVRLAPPFGSAPAAVRPLARDRLRGALGAVSREP